MKINNNELNEIIDKSNFYPDSNNPYDTKILDVLNKQTQNYAKWKKWYGDIIVGINDDGTDRCKHYNYFTCSNCRKGNAIKTNFCPYCGADMRGEKE